MSRAFQLTKEEWDKLIADIEAGVKQRADLMPTEQDAIGVMFRAWERLKELGWREAMYAPRDGRMLEFIEAGSTGIHRGHKEGKFTWIHDAGDLWPANPVLFREPNTDAERIGKTSPARNPIEQKSTQDEQQ